MQNYIENVKYIKTELRKQDIVEIQVPLYERLKIEQEHPSYNDATLDFNQNKYKYPYIPLYLGEFDIPQVEDINLNVLRLMIRENSENNSIFLPEQLLPLKNFILENVNYHNNHYGINKNCFIYITVRTSDYDNLFYQNSSDWHIDGFQGSRIKRHIIEQDSFWCNKSPTEFLIQPFFCENLNPSKHDINDFFEKNSDLRYLLKTKPNSIYFVNPYNIHRVSKERFDGKRVFIRLNFSPVLIEDFTNTINPFFEQYKFTFRRDVRDFLGSYKTEENVDSGFYFS
jgi:hypothetical protein